MNDLERYLFDLRGYVVVKEALSPGEVAALNRCLDERGVDELLDTSPHAHIGLPHSGAPRSSTGDPARGPVTVDWGLLLDWGAPFRRLVAHPRVTPHVETLLGPAFRLDHSYAILSRGGGAGQTPLRPHNGGTPFDPTQYYLVRDGRIHCGLVVVSFALTDMPAGEGGFCCVPGSHKAKFALPPEIAALADPTDPLVQVPAAAGDAIIFTEALTHGTTPWSAQHDRRSVLLKYTRGSMQWERRSPTIEWDVINEAGDWTEAERRVLTGPYAPDRPSVRAEL